MNRLSKLATLVAMEPPFRRVTKSILSLCHVNSRLRSLWDISRRPQYLMGLLAAADQAALQGCASFSAIEFGVAGGYGLLSMQRDAKAVEQQTGIAVRVYGFDTGVGLPIDMLSDYRDHPDIWKPGDYPMNERELRAKLSETTTLVLGNVADTVKSFFETHNPPPVGFVSNDLDLYSGSKAAMRIFRGQGGKMLHHVPVYLDDIDMFYTHSKGGELLAMHEFNLEQNGVFIDQWRGIKSFRPFPEAPYLDRMFIAHDLEAISTAKPRDVAPRQLTMSR